MLDVAVYQPVAAGPAPLVLFAHGLGGHPDKFTRLFGAWAAAGYAVLAPTFPLSNDRATPGGGVGADFAEQAGDLAFVLDAALGHGSAPSDALGIEIDDDAVGVAGLSLGGATTYNFAFDDARRDHRVDAVAVFNPLRLPTGRLDLAVPDPVLLIHADGDPVLPHEDTVAVFAETRAPSWFVTLHEQVHAEPYEDMPDPADDLVHEVSIAFWDRYLRGDGTGEDRIRSAIAEAGPLATLIEK